MTKVNLQYAIANLTPADANPVEANYSRLEQHINQEVIERDGTVAMRAELLLANDPISALGAATKNYVDLLVPIGVMMPYGGTTAPTKWLLCDGSEQEAAAYPALFAVIGTRYVVGVPSPGRFSLPDLRLRFPIGAQTGVTDVGARGGTADAIVPAHTHPVDHTHAAGTTQGDSPDHAHTTVDHLHGFNLNTGGESASHDHTTAPGHVVYRQNTVAPGFYMQVAGGGLLPGDLMSLDSLVTGGERQAHYHNVSGQTGAADRSLGTTGANARHTHVFQPPTFSGASGPASGAAATTTGANLPPYVAMTYIIKAL